MKTQSIPLIAVLLFALAGCSQKPNHDLTGRWGQPNKAGKMTVFCTFREDGAFLYGEDALVAMWRQRNGKLEMQVDGVWRSGPCLWIDDNHIEMMEMVPGQLERMK